MHTAIQLLNHGYQVVGTLRNAERIPAVKEIISKRSNNTDQLSFAIVELTDTAVWQSLMQDISNVLHIASPFPSKLPKQEEELITPAREGTLNVLKAATTNGVKRVVVVSSLAAVVYGKTKAELEKVFDEHDWTDESNKKDTTPYFRSKTIAEKAAWSFIKNSNSDLELTTILPGAILGPVLEKDFGTSANIIIKMLDGSSPAIPKIGFDIVDVRSVADLLIRAMESPIAAGNRYIASAGYLTFNEIATILLNEYPNRKIPQKELPNFAARLFSLFEPSLKPILLELGIKRKTDISKAARDLEWQPLSTREAISACAKSIIENGIVK